jgi:hypothetical protein
MMNKAEAVELVRKAQRDGVLPAIILAFLDVSELQDRFSTPAGSVSPKRPDYSDN